MRNCRDVARLVSTGGLADAPLTHRLSVRFHLAMCRRCRAFRRQIEAIGEAAAAASLGVDRELPEDFESRIFSASVRNTQAGSF